MNGTRIEARDMPVVALKKGAVARPFQVTSAALAPAYWIALSVICAVQAPDGSLEMIFWSSSALAVRS